MRWMMLFVLLLVLQLDCAKVLHVGGIDEVERIGIKKSRITQIDTVSTRNGRAYIVHYR
jgi:hypothetical protein